MAPRTTQTAAIVVTANSIDIRNGELALSKTQNGEVREFARHMITDHTSMNGKANDLATRLQMTPEPSDASRQLESDAARTMEDLKAKTGEDFERAYAAGEVALHQKLISMVDDTLIPQARNEELKAQLVAARPILVLHLEHAQQVDSTLRADGAR